LEVLKSRIRVFQHPAESQPAAPRRVSVSGLILPIIKA